MSSTTSIPITAGKRPQRGSLLGTIVEIWPYLWPADRLDLQRTVLVSLVLMVASKLVTVAMPFTFKWATDSLVAATGGKTPPGEAVPWIIGAPLVAACLYGITRIAMSGLTQVREGMFAAVAMHAVRKLALQTFEHMHRLSLRFHLERKTGGLTRVLERGRNGIEEITRMTLMTLAPTVVEFVLVIGVFAVEFDWRYIVVTCLMIAAYLAYTIHATNWRIAIRRTMNESDTDANTKAVDSLLNYETVKYFGAERREAERYDRSLDVFEHASIRTYTSLAWLNFGQVVVFTVGLTICMAMAAMDIIAGRQSVGHFVMVNAMLVQLAVPLNFMGMVYREIKQAIIDIEKMFEVLEHREEVADRPDAKPLVVDGGTVTFENVFFHYQPERPILEGVSFTVPAGKTVAVVGPSGAGKSTLSRLLFRFYDVTGGRILIDGQDIRDVTQASLREAIGMVPQDTVLFNDTLGYNLAYGKPEAGEGAVKEAARLAQIDRFIALLPEGYQAQVGERGLKLSGGEKQRVAIARTILKGPPILMLDEATSALDSFTEREIQDALDKVSEGRTTLVIAHRLSTVVGADQIMVLDQGRIVERGTHAELLALKGAYAAMWNRQREAQQAEETLKRIAEAEGESLRRHIGGAEGAGAPADARDKEAGLV